MNEKDVGNDKNFSWVTTWSEGLTVSTSKMRESVVDLMKNSGFCRPKCGFSAMPQTSLKVWFVAMEQNHDSILQNQYFSSDSHYGITHF